MCWKVESEVKIDPPIQTEYFRSSGAMILIFMVSRASRGQRFSSSYGQQFWGTWSYHLI